MMSDTPTRLEHLSDDGRLPVTATREGDKLVLSLAEPLPFDAMISWTEIEPNSHRTPRNVVVKAGERIIFKFNEATTGKVLDSFIAVEWTEFR